jgi:hypothetical protein
MSGVHRIAHRRVDRAVLTQGRVAVSGDLVLRWPFPAFSTWNRP